MDTVNDTTSYYKDMLTCWRRIKRLRKNLSPRMKAMLDCIKSKGKMHYNEFKSYNDKRTLNALGNRLLVRMGFGPLRDYYVFDGEFTDEDVNRYIEVSKKELKRNADS